MSRTGLTASASLYSDPGEKNLSIEDKHQQLIESLIFRMKDDRSYQLDPKSLQLIRAAEQSESPRKYKPGSFEFRALNNVSKSWLRFIKVPMTFKEAAEKLHFHIDRSKYRNIA